MRKLWFDILILAGRLCVGGIFFASGIMKISDLNAFAQAVHAYNMLPLFVVNIFAIVVPWIEVVSGLCLFVGFWTKSNALILFVLLSSFIIAIGVNLFRGVDLACGCFALDGLGGGLVEALIRDVFLMVIMALLFFSQNMLLSFDRFLDHRKVSWPPMTVRVLGENRETEQII